MYQYILAIHIIFVVCWMAGLFYMVRLFIYHTEAQDKPEPDRTILSDQFEIMEKKLWWIIATPSMYLVLAAGISMANIDNLWKESWLNIKLLFVVGLIIYHFICQHKMKQMAKGIFTWSSTQLRIWNELATLFLFAIVFLAVLKDAISWIYGVVGIVLLSLILMSAVKIYKYFRMRKTENSDPVLKQKIEAIKADLEKLIEPVSGEKYSIMWYGAYWIDPKHLIFWVCVQSDRMKGELMGNRDLMVFLRETLKKNDYPIDAKEFVHIGFESQETVDRESNGNWYKHFK